MGTKNNPGKYDCYGAAGPDEPTFTLLARDRHAPALIWLWATLRELDDEDPEKVAEAREVLVNMMKWKKENGGQSVGLGQAALAAVLELVRAANYGAKTHENEATGNDAIRLFLAETRVTPYP